MMAAFGKTKKQGCRVDIHHHIVPAFYTDALDKAGIKTSFGLPFPKWSPDEAIKVMDSNRIAAAVTSISTPGIHFGNSSLARDLARRCNEYSAQLSRDYPGRFGAFASLPVPDAENALREMEYALDTLKLDGVVFMSNVEGHYPGGPEYDLLFAELNRRKAVVFIHPNDPPDKGIPDYLKGALDAALDTTRAVMSLLYAGYLERYTDVKIILSHAGGIVPYMARRIALGRYEEANRPACDKGMFDFTLHHHTLEDSIGLLRNLYYDTLSPAGNSAFRSLQALVDSSHILLGTDYVFLPKIYTAKKIAAIRGYKGFNHKEVAAIEAENALSLFPRLKEWIER